MLLEEFALKLSRACSSWALSRPFSKSCFLCTYAVGGANFPSKTLSFDEGLSLHLDDDGQDDVSILEQLDFTGDRVGDGVSL